MTTILLKILFPTILITCIVFFDLMIHSLSAQTTLGKILQVEPVKMTLYLGIVLAGFASFLNFFSFFFM